MPVWHASVAVRGYAGQMTPWERCGLKTRVIVRETVLDMLRLVGAGNTRRDRSDFVMHARRRLNEAEIALLSPAWCALPAVATAGDGIPW